MLREMFSEVVAPFKQTPEGLLQQYQAATALKKFATTMSTSADAYTTAEIDNGKAFD